MGEVIYKLKPIFEQRRQKRNEALLKVSSMEFLSHEEKIDLFLDDTQIEQLNRDHEEDNFVF